MSYRSQQSIHVHLNNVFGTKEAPSAIESEKFLVGLALLEPETISDLRKITAADDFYDLNFQKFFAAICVVADSVGSVDPALLFEQLAKDPAFDKQEFSVDFFIDLSRKAVSAVPAEHHAKNVREAARLRELIRTCGETAYQAYERQTDATTLISGHTERIASLVQTEGTATGRLHGQPVILRMSDVQPKQTTWLWKGRIPQKAITILSGRPGEGKSIVTTDAAARVSTGRNWPDGSPCVQGTVILVAGEDDPEETIRPRLDAHGADVSKVCLITGVTRISAKGEESEVMFTLADVATLERALDENPDCRLVIIDPIGSFVGGAVDTDKDNKVRAVLAPLAKLARVRGVAILLVAHTRKGTASHADDMVMGSRAFTGIARSVQHLMVDPEDKERRVLLPGKSNLGRPAEGLAFTIAGEPPRIEWDPEPVHLTADGVLASHAMGESTGRTERDDVADWLEQHLSSGPRPATDVQNDARDAGHSVATLRRAKAALGVVALKPTFSGPWMWSLPTSSQDAQPPKVLTEDAHAIECEHLGGKQGKNNGNSPKMLNGTRMSILGGRERLRNFGLDDGWGGGVP